MKKRPPLFRVVLIALLASFIALFAAAGVILSGQRAAIERLEERIELLKDEFVPVRFMVLSRSDQSVSARFRFYDADGKEIASFERSWNGSELAIDSIVVPIADRVVAFPFRVFTDAVAPGKGTELFDYYDRDGFPAIFWSVGLDGKLKSALVELFARVRAYEKSLAPIPGLYGSAVHDLRRLGAFEVGSVYSLVVRARGGIEIIRE